ncbi:hypothetical protein KIL84_003126 [Mauremys mutica]|uniref:Uncharacterized protein n=1 Tax=Mauremys mutica TaxID=74926 RepID=A0A9D3WVX6_9SAUR|nr:hypothetical protein KIL84_003126 [Mauremys mutica]
MCVCTTLPRDPALNQHRPPTLGPKTRFSEEHWLRPAAGSAQATWDQAPEASGGGEGACARVTQEIRSLRQAGGGGQSGPCGFSCQSPSPWSRFEVMAGDSSSRQ